MTKPPVARKLAARHLCVRQLVFWLLVVSSFNYFCCCCVPHLCSGEVGVCTLNSHRNYIVDHGKSWNSVGTLSNGLDSGSELKFEVSASEAECSFSTENKTKTGY